jgi:hypothetical protein
VNLKAARAPRRLAQKSWSRTIRIVYSLVHTATEADLRLEVDWSSLPPLFVDVIGAGKVIFFASC